MEDEVIHEEYRLSFELVGHERDVKGVCALKNGDIATASRDKQIKIWTLQEGKKWEAVTTLLGHESFVGPLIETNNQELVSGGYDNAIIIWDLNTNLPKKKLEGHEKPVVCLALTTEGDIVSGSWDKVIRVWSKEGEIKKILRGHAEAVWDVIALENGDIWSASADKTIKIWRNGNCWKTLTSATDCVRGLCKTEHGIASVANDTILRLWDFDGNELAQGYGHTAYAYCVKYNSATQEIVTGGEDSSLKVWKGNQCTQTLTIPGSVWCVDVLSNGDIVTGSSDYIARVWTKNSLRIGSVEVQNAFELRIKEAAEKSQAEQENSKSGLLDMNKLPTKEVGLMTAGFEGQQIIVKNENGEAEVHVFEKGKWNLLGVVTDNPNTKGKKHVFPVELDGIKYEMGYNEGDNIYEVAEKFLANNGLEEGFLDQVIEFLLQNTANLPKEQPKKNVRPNTSYFPSTGMLNFSNNKFEPVLKKLKEFNEKVKEQAPQLALDDINRSDTQTLTSLISKLSNASFYHSVTFSSSELLLILNLCTWPGNLKFPALDILRQMFLVESASEALENAAKHLTNKQKGIVGFILDNGLTKESDFASKMLSLRALCNMSKHATSKSLLFASAVDVLDRVTDCTSDAKENVREAVASLLVNFATCVIDNKHPSAPDVKLPMVSMIGEALDSEKVHKIVMYYVLALGTIAWNDVQTVGLVNDLSITEKIEQLQKSEVPQIREAAGQLYTHVKSFDMDTK